MNIPIAEQETTIGWYRNSDTAHIYTSDRTMMTKLDKLADDPDSPWTRVRTERSDGDIVACRYTAPRNLISFRRAPLSRVLTEEQRAEAAERLRSYRELRKNQAEQGADDNSPI